MVENVQNRVLSRAEQSFMRGVIEHEAYAADAEILKLNSSGDQSPEAIARKVLMLEREGSLSLANSTLRFLIAFNGEGLKSIKQIVEIVLGDREPVLSLPGGDLKFDFERMNKKK